MTVEIPERLAIVRREDVGVERGDFLDIRSSAQTSTASLSNPRSAVMQSAVSNLQSVKRVPPPALLEDQCCEEPNASE